MTGPIWIYRPTKHKTAYRGKLRTIALGPQAQALLREFFTDDPTEFLFSPRKAVTELNAQRAAKRKTKYYESRQGWQKRKESPKRVPGELYTVCSYGYAIRRACRKASIEAWHPNQLRHTYATEVRRRFGLNSSTPGRQ
jgi:integrase